MDGAAQNGSTTVEVYKVLIRRNQIIDRPISYPDFFILKTANTKNTIVIISPHAETKSF